MKNDPFEFGSAAFLQDQRAESSGSIFSINSVELPKVIEQANLGNSESSFRLYQYSKFSRSNLNEAQVWLIQAAQQGHVTAQYNAAVSFVGRNNCSQAMLWAIKAKDNGHKDADRLINEIKDKVNQK